MDIENLPPEIIADILERDPELILKSRRISREVSQLLDPAYLRRFCRKKISTQEFNRYLSTQPKIFAFIRQFESSEVDDGFAPVIRTQLYIDEVDSYRVRDISSDHDLDLGRYVLFLDQVEIIAERDISNIRFPSLRRNIISSIDYNYPDIISPDGEIDLLSMYTIIRMRLSCLKINPQLAKETVIERFNQIVNGYLNHPSRLRILDLYIYLLVHMWIFNIEGQVIYPIELEMDLTQNSNNREQLVDNPQNRTLLSDIKSETERLIMRIRNELNRLQ